MTETYRVASVQMALHASPDPDMLLERISHHTRVAKEYGCDFVCFGEHLTLQILASPSGPLDAVDAIDQLTEFTDTLKDTLSFLARKHQINIVGGSHASKDDDGTIRNTAWLAHRDGQLSAQSKLHPTPDEADVWNIKGGDSLDVIETDCGPVGITICYDSEFPELGRRLADEGALITFVPYLTDTEHGHWRVTHCCQARAIENQCFLVTAGLCGTISHVTNLDMAYAQSRIITPCDTGFARAGISVETTANVEQMIFADLDLAAVKQARKSGAVRNLADRRDDLYSVEWR